MRGVRPALPCDRGRRMIRIQVPLGNRSYTVLVGGGAHRELASVIPEGAKRAAVVTQRSIGLTVDPGIDHSVHFLDDGEETKVLSTVERLCSEFAESGLTRRDVVVAVGGGVVTDVGGFAAAVYHRGVAVVHVATTLLGQIDASIGGKTGVNLPEGKNLVGAFWQPSAVICDTGVLSSLAPRELRSGLGELAKYHFLAGDSGPVSLDELPLDERVAACVRIKAEIVGDDEREGGRRALLNYGHTLAHALEIEGSFDLRHGEAVAIGLVYAAELSHVLGRIDEKRVAEHRRVVEAYGLSSELPENTDHDRVIELFARDKKAIDAITFVLDGPCGPEVVTDVGTEAMREALDIMVTSAPGPKRNRR